MNLRTFACLTAWLVLLQASPLSALTLRIGAPGDPACSAFSVPGGIAQLPAGGPHRVLLSTNHSYETLGTISRPDLSIEGGYANCSATQPTAGARTRIGTGTAATLLNANGPAAAPGQTYQRLTLRNLEVRGPAPQGAIRASGAVELYLIDSIVADAGDLNLDYGGGIQASAGAAVELQGQTQILSNRGGAGAGISCVDASLYLNSGALLISGNQARVAGGGVYGSHCYVDWTLPDASPVGGINGNRAVLGGGMALIDSELVSSTTDYDPRRIVANTADYVAGGLYLERSVVTLAQLSVNQNTAGVTGIPNSQGNCGGVSAYSSQLTLDRADVIGNRAYRNGGGICLQNASSLVLSGAPCADGRCRLLQANRAGFANAIGAGGAFYLDNDSSLLVEAAEISDNLAHESVLLYATDNSGARINARLLSSLIVRNQSDGAGGLAGFDGTSLQLRWSTVVDNVVGAAHLFDFGNSRIDLGYSLIYANGLSRVLSAPFGTTLTTTCMHADESSSLSFHGGAASTASPGFVDRGAGNYRLTATGNAVDACIAQAALEPATDLVGTRRPQELPIVNIDGPWDAGAYETPLAPDAIFNSGFE